MLTTWSAGACKPEAPDVLQEFPPPRLAKVTPSAARDARSMAAECAAELSLRTRSESKTLHLREAHGTLELPPGNSRELNATLTIPLPGDISVGSGASTEPLVWRVIEVRERDDVDNFAPSAAPRAATATTLVRVVAELEFNKVRTQRVHLLEFEYSDDPAAGPTKVHLSRLSLDPGAHRLQFPTSGRPSDRRTISGDATLLKRAELSVHCGLREIDRSKAQPRRP